MFAHLTTYVNDTQYTLTLTQAEMALLYADDMETSILNQMIYESIVMQSVITSGFRAN